MIDVIMFVEGSFSVETFYELLSLRYYFQWNCKSFVINVNYIWWWQWNAISVTLKSFFNKNDNKKIK